MMKRSSWLLLASLALAIPAMAQAEDAYVTGNVNMRAGPDIGYPLVAQIPAGTEVDVQGCTSGWEWCDVIAYNSRGWVAGNFIQYDDDSQDVLLPAYGAQIGIPIIAFSIGSYWDRYYRARPFYRERDHWYRRRIIHHAPPRPIHRPYARPHDGRGYPGSRHPDNRPGHLGPIGPGHAVRRVSPVGHDSDHNARPGVHPIIRPGDHAPRPPQEHRNAPHGRPGSGAPPGHLGPINPGHPAYRAQPQTHAAPHRSPAPAHGHSAAPSDSGHHGSDHHGNKDDHHH